MTGDPENLNGSAPAFYINVRGRGTIAFWAPSDLNFQYIS